MSPAKKVYMKYVMFKGGQLESDAHQLWRSEGCQDEGKAAVSRALNDKLFMIDSALQQLMKKRKDKRKAKIKVIFIENSNIPYENVPVTTSHCFTFRYGTTH
jgi:hypothetical protein